MDRLKLIPLGELAETLFMGVNSRRLSQSKQTIAPIIHIKDVIDSKLSALGELDEISLPATPQTARQRLLPYDILVSARGTLMKCALVEQSHSGAVASANFIVIRLAKNSMLRPELLWAYLRYPATQAHVLNQVASTAQPALNIRTLENLLIPIPPKNIQSDLARLTLVAEEQYRCAIECAELRRLEAMDILIQHMDARYAS